MRWPVEVILDMLGSGMSTDQILEDHKELEREDILACLNFAKMYLTGKTNSFRKTSAKKQSTETSMTS